MPRKVDRGRAFLFYPDDYLDDPVVLAMGTLGRGAYGGALLPALWRQPEPGVVVADDKVLAHLALSSPRVWAQVKMDVARAFDTTSRPGYWVQKRMVAEYAKQQEWNERVGGARSRAARSRWTMHEKSKQDAFAVQLDAGSGSGSGSGSGEEEEHVRTPAAPASAPASFATRNGTDNGTTSDQFFDRHFWPLYPRKRGRPAALRAWRRIVGVGEGDDRAANAICNALESLLAGEWRDQETRFIPHAHKWLSKGEWES